MISEESRGLYWSALFGLSEWKGILWIIYGRALQISSLPVSADL